MERGRLAGESVPNHGTESKLKTSGASESGGPVSPVVHGDGNS